MLSAVMNCHTHLHIIVIDGVYTRQQCPVCQTTMLLRAVITRREVIDRILTHVKVHSSFSFRVAGRELLASTTPRLRRCKRGAAEIGPAAMFPATPRFA